MLKTQRQRCKQPVIVFIKNVSKIPPKGHPQNRQVMGQFQKKQQKTAEVNSDINHNHRMVGQQKLLSLNLGAREQVRVQQKLDKYRLGTPYPQRSKNNQQIQVQDKYNQCLPDERSSIDTGQIFSHYTQSKSCYKDTKKRARKIIQKMYSASKNNSQNITNQLKQKIQAVKSQLSNKNSSEEQYCPNDLSLKKYNSALNSSGFRPKVQKCSTLKLTGRQECPLSTVKNADDLSVHKSQDSSKQQRNEQLEENTQAKQKKGRRIKILLTNHKQTTITANKQAPQTNQNPLVLQGKHLFAQQVLNEYYKPSTQKQIKVQTQNACRQVSKQMPISKRQTQKIITRARQKNMKVIVKLKEIKQRRSSLRDCQMFKNDLTKNVPRLSKLAGGAFRQGLEVPRECVPDQPEYEASEQDFLSLNSNINSVSVIAFNQQIRQKILIHLQTIKIFADYAQSFTNTYQDCDQWEDLIFLLYKKYYVERFKVYCLLKQGLVMFKDGTTTKESPFILDFCSVSDQQIGIFRESKEQVSLQLELDSSNYQIKNSLRDLYNKFIVKTSQNPSINMYEVDDFAEQILQGLYEEINILIQSCGKSQKIKIKINQAIQVGLMIAHLEGLALVDIEEIVLGEVQSKDYFDRFYSKFMDIFQDQKKDR